MLEPAPIYAQRSILRWRGLLDRFSAFAMITLVGSIVALLIPWHVSRYHMTQWILFDTDILQMRGFPSLVTGTSVGFPATADEIEIVYRILVLFFNLISIGCIAYLFRSLSGARLVIVTFFVFSGNWILFNEAVIPNIDLLIYLPAMLGIGLSLLAAARGWLLPILWLLSLWMIWIHPAAVFGAMPLMYAVYFLLRPVDRPWAQEIGKVVLSVLVIGVALTIALNLNTRPNDTEMAALIDERLVDVQSRAEFRISTQSAVSSLQTVEDVLQIMVLRERDFFGIRFGNFRWHFTAIALVFFAIKIFFIFQIFNFYQIRLKWRSLELTKKIICFGAVAAPLPLFILATDYHRWLGCIDWNLTIVLIVVIFSSQADERRVTVRSQMLPVVTAVFLLQLFVASVGGQSDWLRFL